MSERKIGENSSVAKHQPMEVKESPYSKLINAKFDEYEKTITALEKKVECLRTALKLIKENADIECCDNEYEYNVAEQALKDTEGE